MPSPAKSFTQDVPVKSEAHVDYVNGNMAEGWTEPPLRTPAPSFEDYKGLERHGVLEHMAPLGSLPGHKVKARLKQHEPPRRIPHLKNGDAGGAREDVKTPESTQPIVTRRSEPRKSEEKLAKVSSSKEGDLDEDYNPRVNTRITPIKATSTHTAAAGTAISRIPSGQLRLQQIVESAISRSRELGDPALGLALRRLYEESLRNTVLNDLLEAILSQRPSSHQTAEFQSYIKAARRQMKEGDDSAKRSKRSASKSPAARTRAHVTRHCRTAKDRTTNALGVNYNLPNCSPQISRQHADMTAANGSPSKDEHPSKRIKRSRSVSSDSSLSSLDSTIEDFVPAIEAALPTAVRSVSASKSNQSKLQPSLGPRLGSFSTRPSDPSNRRPIIAANYPTAEELAAKKREKLDKLKQGFQDYVVRDSGIRASPSPMKYHQSIPPTGVLAERTQSRLRNSVGQKGRRDEHEALDSPASSACGEMLVPPPPGASRGVTPNQLGRPPKAVKKAARIKIS